MAISITARRVRELSQKKSFSERSGRSRIGPKARRVFCVTSNHGVNDMAAKKKKKAAAKKAVKKSAKKTKAKKAGASAKAGATKNKAKTVKKKQIVGEGDYAA